MYQIITPILTFLIGYLMPKSFVAPKLKNIKKIIKPSETNVISPTQQKKAKEMLEDIISDDEINQGN